MVDETPDREPIVSEGRYAVVGADDTDSSEYWLVASDGSSDFDRERRVPLERSEIDDLYAVISRLRGSLTDADDESDSVELTCQNCGKTWTYTGSEEHAACPNCETEVPVEGIGP